MCERAPSRVVCHGAVSVKGRAADAMHLLPSGHGAVACTRLSSSCLSALKSGMQPLWWGAEGGCGCRSLRHAT